MASKRFNLGDYNLPGLSVSAPETEQIKLIPLDLIDPDPNNFYSLEGIDELAANIETVGLLDPLRVRPVGERYTLVSGHRRRAACMLIRDGGSEMFKNGVPSIVERGEASDALRELRLLSANSATRIMSDADLSKQAERMTAVLYQLKQEGYKFPGKMRTIVAQACQVSESKLARLHAIRANLCEPMLGMFDKGRLNESVAYRISQETPETQERIWKDQGDVLHNLTADGISAYLAHVRFLDSQKAAAETRAVEDAGPYRDKFDADEYIRERTAEDLRYLDMAGALLDHLIHYIPGVIHNRREGIDALKHALRWSSLGGASVNYDGRGNGLELYRRGSNERLLRSWTEAYDALCTAAINRLGKNNAWDGEEPEDEEDDPSPAGAGAPLTRGAFEPEWQTGDPPEDGWYCCWATWEPKSNKWDPDREFLYWRGCTWFDTKRAADNCIPAQYAVHKWYPVPDDPEEE